MKQTYLSAKDYLSDLDYWVGDDALSLEEMQDWFIRANGILADLVSNYQKLNPND